MIIKNLRIKQSSKYRIKQLVRYVLEDNDPKKNPFKEFVILQNIHTLSIDKIHKAFLAQDKYRKQRKNGICYYHEVLSFSPKDKEYITSKILEDIARKYIEIRGAKQTVVLAKGHLEKDHLHIHFLISATKYKSSESLRLNNQNYRRVQRQMEQYQQTHYPKLIHSIVYLKKERKRPSKKRADINRRSENEFQLKLRLEDKTPTKKEVLQRRVSKLLERHTTAKSFLVSLENETDFELYKYRGKIKGIVFEGKKFRFTTIGISKQALQKLQAQYQRQQQLQNTLTNPQHLGRGS